MTNNPKKNSLMRRKRQRLPATKHSKEWKELDGVGRWVWTESSTYTDERGVSNNRSKYPTAQRTPPAPKGGAS